MKKSKHVFLLKNVSLAVIMLSMFSHHSGFWMDPQRSQREGHTDEPYEGGGRRKVANKTNKEESR